MAEAAELVAWAADDSEETGALLDPELTVSVEAALEDAPEAAAELLLATTDDSEETIASLKITRQLLALA